VSATLGEQMLHIPLTFSAQRALDSVTVSVAASNIAFAKEKVSGITIQNQLACKVTAIQQVGHRVLVTVGMDGTDQQLIAEITSASLNQLGITLGTSLFCLIKTQSIYPLASHWSRIGT
jgi:molybdopterin-binding protein